MDNDEDTRRLVLGAPLCCDALVLVNVVAAVLGCEVAEAADYTCALHVGLMGAWWESVVEAADATHIADAADIVRAAAA